MKNVELEIKTIDGEVSHEEADILLFMGINEDATGIAGCFGGGKIKKSAGFRWLAKSLVRAMSPLFKNGLEPFLFLKVLVEEFEEEYKEQETKKEDEAKAE